MHFYFVTCMHLLNIIVYLYASSTTCAQKAFHVYSSQTDKLINLICVYMPMVRCCGSSLTYISFGGMVGGKKMRVGALLPVPSIDMSFSVLTGNKVKSRI